MDIYLDVNGVLLKGNSRDKLFDEMARAGFIPSDEHFNVMRIRERELRRHEWLASRGKAPRVPKRRDQGLMSELFEDAMKKPECQKFFREWFRKNAIEYDGVKKSIEEFRKENKAKVIINSGFEPFFTEQIAKEIGADGFNRQKQTNTGNFMIDDKLRRFSFENQMNAERRKAPKNFTIDQRMKNLPVGYFDREAGSPVTMGEKSLREHLYNVIGKYTGEKKKAAEVLKAKYKLNGIQIKSPARNQATLVPPRRLPEIMASLKKKDFSEKKKKSYVQQDIRRY